MTEKTTQNITSQDSGEELKSAAKRSAVYVVGQALARSVGFLMIPVYTRYIEPGDYGISVLVGIVGNCLMFIVSMSFNEAMVRHYYDEQIKEKRDIIVSTAFIGMAVCSMPIVLLAVGFSQDIALLVLEQTRNAELFQVIFITMWFSALLELGTTYFRMMYMSKTFVTVTTIQLIISLSFNIYFVVFAGLGIHGIFYSMLISHGTMAIILSIGILLHLKSGFSFDYFMRMVKFGLPMVPARIGTILGYMSDRFFLQRFASATDLGLYSLGYNFGIVISRFVNTPIKMAWGPKAIELLLGDDPQNGKRMVVQMCTYSTLLSIFAALGLSVMVEDVIIIMADQSYRESYKIVPVIALTMVFSGLENHFNVGILVSGKTKFITYIGTLSLCLIVILNMIFVPLWGIWGASLSTMAVALVRSLLVLIASQYLLRIPFELVRIAAMLVLSLVMFAVCMSVHFEDVYLNLMVRTILSFGFPLILLVTPILSKEDRNNILSTIMKTYNHYTRAIPLLRATRSE
jgi:O-antigen/teichoic acid export membrane protein